MQAAFARQSRYDRSLRGFSEQAQRAVDSGFAATSRAGNDIQPTKRNDKVSERAIIGDCKGCQHLFKGVPKWPILHHCHSPPGVSSPSNACMLRQCEPSQNTRWQISHVLKRWKCARTLGGKRSSTSALSMLCKGALQCRQSVKGRALRARSSRSKTSFNCWVDLSART